MIIVRMPPSPTGSLHLGTARTALFNWLVAKSQNGKIIFRWEDTDRERSEKKYEKEILDGLSWLGMDFTKECEKIYRQTESAKRHNEVIQILWEEGKIFPCFMTKEEIDEEREKANKEKRNFVLWSKFREISKEEAEEKMKTEDFVWRLKTAKSREISFQDKIRGQITVNTNTLGDFVLARKNGTALYLLANVIDDFDQGINLVLRGEDGLSNTPKQILLYEALGWAVPEFGHIPLVIDKQGKKLSKRNVNENECVLINDFRKQGFLPEGVVNGLVLLGWNPKSEQEIFSLSELEKIFAIKNVNSAASKYDMERMLWFNAQWMRKISLEDLQQNFREFSGEIIEPKFLELAREKARTLVELQDELSYLISDPGIDEELLGNEKMKFDKNFAKKILKQISTMLEEISESKFSRENLREISISKIAELEVKNGQFLWPFRVALSNRRGSAGPFEIAEVIGKAETLRRIKRAMG